MSADPKVGTCVIGAGPAGLTVATEMARSGRHVMLIESGGVTPDERHQKLNVGTSVGYPYFPLDTTRYRAYGGTSHRWLGHIGLRARPLDDLDFDKRPGIEDSGWPIDRSELDSYYATAQEVCGLGPFRYDPSEWDDLPDTLFHESETVDDILFQFSPATAFQSVDALPASVELITGATVTELVSSRSGGEVAWAEVRRHSGESMRISADQFVLAGGGVENTRLLLSSLSEGPRGLGNSSGLLGRFFMEHLRLRGGWIEPGSTLPDLGFYSRFTRDDTVLMGALRPNLHWTKESGNLNCALYLNSSQRYSLEPSYRNAVAGMTALLGRSDVDVPAAPYLKAALSKPAQLGRAVANRLSSMGSRSADALEVALMAEQSPNPDSRMYLGPDRDRFGVPRVVLDWQLSEVDHRSMAQAESLLIEEARRLGLGEGRAMATDETQPRLVRGNWHHMGTTRMSSDPAAGVVDRNLRLHDVSNVYVAGSSVFPTGGFANPTLTVVALALRLAEHLNSGS